MSVCAELPWLLKSAFTGRFCVCPFLFLARLLIWHHYEMPVTVCKAHGVLLVLCAFHPY